MHVYICVFEDLLESRMLALAPDLDGSAVPTLSTCHLGGCWVNVAIGDGRAGQDYQAPQVGHLKAHFARRRRACRTVLSLQRFNATALKIALSKRNSQVELEPTWLRNYLMRVQKCPPILCPSLLSKRRWHRFQEFKSPGWVHDCAVAVCTPAERGGGEMHPGTFFQRERRLQGKPREALIPANGGDR